MATIISYTLVSVVLTTLISLVGILVLLATKKIGVYVSYLVGLAAGALLGDVFVHIIPEIFDTKAEPTAVASLILTGVLVFFVLERFLRHKHSHVHAHEKEGCSKTGIQTVGHMNLISDGAHNLIDGIAIGASYLVSIPVGIATTLAVILHEIPQEIGDFGLLLHAGFSKKKALLFNLLSATLAIVGAMIALAFSAYAEDIERVVLPITAGSFLYIALADLLPILQETTEKKRAVLELLFVFLGIGLMFAIRLVE
ncbi:MAG: ZIP family metal transporter [Candidatus Vogelbacteria bacterium CG10_big_fil_rev_8_21_14_0_10_51_16]|uniref:ZIP family metal transporter n=1 Tax=Candidatus Vogelbacteria bacterium CG10_big_fil_rev_8_21_14_0_10_51_16 TaxID=1975045 RepID=A0A2H0RFF5_9BACT|nr:MAG: ZIP family metal transporter [Candidatus Vogelbacteria bacterium CG10_big_fil_rev_8_21_14_0_10_51_16]